MPGYGYAAVAKDKVKAWTGLIHDYLRGRANLARVFVLVDARHGFKPIDTTVMDTLDKSRGLLPDRPHQGGRDEEVGGRAPPRRARGRHCPPPCRAIPRSLLTSSRTGEGIPELRAAVARLLAERGA